MLLHIAIMNNIRNSSLLITLLLLCTKMWGQQILSDRLNEDLDRGRSVEVVERAAAEAYANGDYYAAMHHYRQVFSAEPKNAAALMAYGDCAMRLAALDSAEMAFQRVIDQKQAGADGLAYIRLAEAKYRLGRYEEAREVYRRFLFEERPSAPSKEMLDEAEQRMGDTDWAIAKLNEQLKGLESFGLVDTTRINTKEYSEIAPWPMGDSLYFAAFKYKFEKDENYPKRDLIKVATASVSGSQAPNLVDFNQESRHTTAVTFNRTGKMMYFAVGEYTNVSDIRFQLYQRRRNDDGTWGEAKKLPDFINAEGATTTEPNVGRMNEDGNETLFFVSDRPGGKGGRDIWYSDILPDGSLAAPQNLSLNTLKNDVTPFYDAKYNTLYFSSEGMQGLGGLDIFKSKRRDDNSWENPINVGPPFNSSANDAYYVLTPDGNAAFMASNRRGQYNESEESCCYDIYKANYIKKRNVQFIVTVYDYDTKQPIVGTISNFNDLGEVLPNGNVVSTKGGSKMDSNDAGNRYDYTLNFEHRYQVVVSKPGFTPDTTDVVSTEGFEPGNNVIERKLYLRRGISLFAHALHEISRDTLHDVRFQLFEIPKNTLLAQLTNREGEKFTPTVHYDTRYMVTASKEGYTSDTIEINTRALSKESFQTIVRELYLRPSSLTTYLPINLYFDNDHPDPRTRAVKTTLEYRKTYVDYYNRKQTFLDEFTVPLSGEEKEAALADIDKFFEKDVRGGWDNLFAFTEDLKKMLDKDTTLRIELTLTGFASPIAQSDYNTSLTARRVSSVYNHFYLHDGSIYRPYIEGDKKRNIPPRLFIRLVPRGDSTAPPTVSDSPRDRRNSVYGVPASRERRLEIIGVDLRKNNENPR
ncbi:MAG: tetratricopeptide repeat protein [Saprospiraceae bacterium]|nr:tetratricopeptide repeat protein [Saprospiraceae bacterium]